VAFDGMSPLRFYGRIRVMFVANIAIPLILNTQHKISICLPKPIQIISNEMDSAYPKMREIFFGNFFGIFPLPKWIG
jgi:hypothetical protein